LITIISFGGLPLLYFFTEFLRGLKKQKTCRFIQETTMSLFEKWWDAANALDRDKMAALLDDSFVMVRHQTGEQLDKEQFLDYIMTGIREQVTAQNRRLIYENEDIIVSHSVLDGPMGNNAVMLVRLVKDGKIIRQETGMTPLAAK
jgi:hypothetical protein